MEIRPDTSIRRWKRRSLEAAPAQTWLRVIAVFTLLGAAAVHCTVLAERTDEFGLFRGFCIALSVIEVGLVAALASSNSIEAKLATIGVGAGALAIWLASAMVAVPFDVGTWQHDAAVQWGIATCLEAGSGLIVATVLWRSPRATHPDG